MFVCDVLMLENFEDFPLWDFSLINWDYLVICLMDCPLETITNQQQMIDPVTNPVKGLFHYDFQDRVKGLKNNLDPK